MKKLALMMIAVVSLLAAGMQVSAGGRADAGSYTIEVTGSTSVAPLMETLADTYTEKNPHTAINVSGTGSGDGITGAHERSAELGMSSRNLRASEQGFGLDVLTIAVDAIAVVVHPENPVSNLSIDEIRRIYTGEITSWSEVGGNNNAISVVSREPGSGTRGAFEGIIEFVDGLVPGAIEFDGTGGVRAAVAGNEHAVGYISLGSMSPEVTAVTVNGVEASSEHVIDGSYEIARPFLILYREDEIHQETQKFLDWIMSEEGQSIVSENYVPVNR